ncbi:MAG: acyltransferase family protein [Erythrobacter sp.]
MASAAQSMADAGSGVDRTTARLAFRPEIEGLRAVAIVPVLLVHAGFTQFAGGFIGVDVFFVISGYLITRIILAEMAEEKGTDGFSLTRFYARRFARLGPALWVMLTAVLLAGLWLLVPSDWPSLSLEAIWAAGFGANLYYWMTTDYFATHETALLLHTWSLGVEEQFYLLFPVFLVWLKRWFPGREVWGIGALAVISFVLCLVLSHLTEAAQQAAFYLFPSRAWELALGGLVACGGVKAIERAGVSSALALLGLAMIAAAVFVVDAGSVFPAPGALLPCIGAVLVIAFGAHGPARALLALPPVRWIGRISFSTYLWHWPIMVFWRLEHGVLLDRWSRVGLVIASILAGALSYYAIERPGQRIMLGLRFQSVFRVAIACVAAVVVVSLTARELSPAINSGPAARMALELAQQADTRRVEQYRMGECFGIGIDFETCVRPTAKGNDVVIMGSSYAAMLWRALDQANPDKAVHQATYLGCNPVVDTTGAADCVEAYSRVFAMARGGEIEHLVLASRWHATDAAALARTVSAMRAAGVKVTVIGSPVEYDQSFPRVLAIAERRGDPAYVETMRRAARDAIDPVLQAAVEGAGGRYISQLDFECPVSRRVRKCRHFSSDGKPIHYDTGHLTPQAATDLADAIGAL